MQLGMPATTPSDEGLTLALPNAPTDGDLLVAVIASDPPLLFPTPASWSSAGYLGSTTCQIQIFWSTSPPLEQQQLFPLPGVAGNVKGAVSEWNIGGLDLEKLTTIASGTAASELAVGYDASMTGDIVIAVYQQGVRDATFTRSGWNNWFSGTFDNATAGVDFQTDLPAGEGTEMIASSRSAYYSGYAVTFKPAPTD